MPADMIRQRKIRGADYTGHEFKHGVIIDEETVGVWNMKCNHCGGIHLYRAREIENEAHTKKCAEFKSSNWSGLDRWDAIIRRKYGITQTEYDGLAEFQEHQCAICGKDDVYRALDIDHNHDTGEVRGLLCTNCNTALGRFKDDIEGLEKALYYLKNTPYNEFKYSNAR